MQCLFINSCELAKNVYNRKTFIIETWRNLISD